MVAGEPVRGGVVEQIGVLPDEVEAAVVAGTPTTLRSAFAVPFGTPCEQTDRQPAQRSAPRRRVVEREKRLDQR